MITEKSGKDWTAAIHRFAAKRVRDIADKQLSGYVFKKNSPSCGVERVRVYNAKGMAERQGRGLFAAALMNQCPLLPVEEEGRLNDQKLRENFIERVFAYHRWLQATCRSEDHPGRWCAFTPVTNIYCWRTASATTAGSAVWWPRQNKNLLPRYTTITAGFLWKR